MDRRSQGHTTTIIPVKQSHTPVRPKSRTSAIVMDGAVESHVLRTDRTEANPR